MVEGCCIVQEILVWGSGRVLPLGSACSVSLGVDWVYLEEGFGFVSCVVCCDLGDEVERDLFGILRGCGFFLWWMEVTLLFDE